MNENGQRKRILILAEFGLLNGGERSLLAVIPDLTSRGFDFLALVPEPSDFADALKRLGVQVHHFAFRHQERRRDLSELRHEMHRALLRLSPDLVHANSLSAARVLGPITETLGVPSLGYLRDILKLNRQAVSDLSSVTRLIAVSQATLEFHAQQGLDRQKMRVIYNGVDLDEFHPRSATGYLHRELNLPFDARLILSAGQISLRKGLEVLLDAASRALTVEPRLHFLIAGARHSNKTETVQLENQLQASSRQAPLRGHVHWLGRRADMNQVMQEVELLVHPAHQEPLGRVLLEAFASGLPAVAMSVGGNAEIFQGSALSELLVPPGDARILADRIVQLAADTSWRGRLSVIARETAETRFSALRCAGHLAAEYEDLSGKRRNS